MTKTTSIEGLTLQPVDLNDTLALVQRSQLSETPFGLG